MLTITDLIKNRFLEDFAQITMGDLLTALLLTAVLSCFILIVYRVTYRGVSFNRSFSLSLLLLALVTALAILTVSSNVVLSLGMVGALSIVRFRTAVKDPMDTIFMFWAIVTGIACGAGLVLIAVAATLVIGLVFILAHIFGNKAYAASCLMVIRYEKEAEEDIRAAVSSTRSRIKSCSSRGGAQEMVLEMRMDAKAQAAYEAIRDLPGVREVNMAAYNGKTVL